MTPLDYVTIPGAVLRLTDVNLRQKIILGLAVSFNEHGLKMSNDALAEILDTCSSYVTKLVTDLQSKSYVEIHNARSRHRRIYLAQNDKVGQLLLQHKVQSKKGLLCTGAPSTPAQSANIIKISATLNTNPPKFPPFGEKPGEASAIRFDYLTGRFSGTESALTLWREAYSHIDIGQEIRKAAAWLVGNQDKPKKRIGRFVVNWFTKAEKDAMNGSRKERPKYDRDFSGQTSSVGSIIQM